MNASFAAALDASRQAAGPQHYPQGALYVVATPIGNLADITLRALHVLSLVDCIACEDTRHTQSLLRAYGIERAPGSLLAVHQHNEQEGAARVLERLASGERVAFVSDAGTPAISDPGARLVQAAQAGGHRVMPLPGCSSVTTALSVAGLAEDGRFEFAGFLDTRGAARDAAIARIAAQPLAVVLLEAPHRIAALARALATLGERPVTVARELTKQFEDIATLPAHALADWLTGPPSRERGEFALVVHPRPTPAAGDVQGPGDEALRVLRLLLAELPMKSAVKLAAEITRQPRNALYDAALSMKGEAGD
ncbi:MAG: 16S rRNA (cytidine(1402)-2'-O)-methyltransferase [Burkholderiaceae bacterium]|nr:16S rRNA (cytidine(1402)-2'-O)-methyltransferase [Burkholderiaceae bacterium]